MQKFIFSLFVVLACFAFANAQYQTDSIISLKNPLTESSGLLFLSGTFITHGDSGNPPALYEIDTITGQPSRTVYIGNATNIDWEDITADDDYIYVGDFGNNQGTRQNLRIYKVSIVDYWSSDTVIADTINFSYAEQTSFTPAPFQTNYDCEAMVCRGDSLYIFTKQWGNPGTRAYKLPKTPGTFVTSVYDSISFSSGLVTGAELKDFGINTTLDLLLNTASGPVLKLYSGNSGTFFDKFWSSYSLNLFGSIQAEGICRNQVAQIFISSEAFNGQKAMLNWVSIPIGIEEDANNNALKLYPNPTKDFVIVDFETVQSGKMSVLDATGKLILKKDFSKERELQIQLPAAAGTYFLEVIFEDGRKSSQRVVKL